MDTTNIDNGAVTITTAIYNKPVGKQYDIRGGEYVGKATLGRSDDGHVSIKRLASFSDYAEWVKSCTPYEMRLSGTASHEHDGKPLKYGVSGDPDKVSLTKEFLQFRQAPGIMAIDTDYKDENEVVALYPSKIKQFETHEQIIELLRSLDPALEDVYMCVRDSSSSFICNDDGEQLTGRKGVHTDIAIDDASRIPSVMQVLFDRLWLAGYGWAFVDKGGKVQLRSPVDLAMSRPHQPDFIKASFKNEGGSAVTVTSVGSRTLRANDLTPLTNDEIERVRELQSGANSELEDAAHDYRKQKIEEKVSELVSRGVKENDARHQAEGLYERKQLEQDMQIDFLAHGKVTVRQLLTDGKKYDRQQCKDPLEPDYKATTWFFWNEGRNPIVFGYAHGGAKYYLKENALGYVRSNRISGEEGKALLAAANHVESALGVDALNMKAFYEEMQQIYFVANKSKFMRLFDDGKLNAYSETHLQQYYLKSGSGLLDMGAIEVAPSLAAAWDVFYGLNQRLGLNKKQTLEALSKLTHGALDEAQAIAKKHLLEYLVNHRQVERVERRVDMFADKPSTQLKSGGVLDLVFVHEPLREQWAVDDAMVERVWRDWQEHFPLVDAFLDMLVNARFASDRREAFLWFKAPSSWGKGFWFDGVLNELGLVTEISPTVIEKAFNGAPLGLDLSTAMRSWVLFVDEWKHVKSELKMLNNKITGAAKNQLNTSIPVYLKAFASAETVDALEGETGVEGQFANRLNKFDIADDAPKLEDRALFKQIGKAMYARAVRSKVAQIINFQVELFQSMGELKATEVADKRLIELHVEHGISNYSESLDEHIDNLIEELRKFIRESEASRFPIRLGSQLDRVSMEFQQNTDKVFLDVKGTKEVLLLRNSAKMIRSYIEACYTKSEIAKVGYKTALIKKRLDMDGEPTKRRWVYDEEAGERRCVRGVMLKLE